MKNDYIFLYIYYDNMIHKNVTNVKRKIRYTVLFISSFFCDFHKIIKELKKNVYNKEK